MAPQIQIIALAAFLSVFVVSSSAVKCPGSANYTLTFRADWTTANHPNTPLPNSPHFSALIGCTHGSDYIMWRRGYNASAGVKLVAEQGQTSTLKSEIETQLNAGKAWQLILESGLGAVGELTGIHVQVTSNFPKVSLISMLAPSPDWFVGIDSHDLCDNGKWRDTWDVTMLPPYDSGTDSGLEFTSPNNVTNPPETIFRITNTMEGSFKASEPIKSLGEFRFKRITGAPTATTTATETPSTADSSAGKNSVRFLMIGVSAAVMLAFTLF